MLHPRPMRNIEKHSYFQYECFTVKSRRDNHTAIVNLFHHHGEQGGEPQIAKERTSSVWDEVTDLEHFTREKQLGRDSPIVLMLLDTFVFVLETLNVNHLITNHTD
ncbi:hypothetical protein WICPIJ_003092 [Wickerhamomyces pijperi]|uniref:Uncharacterized protein n=1 Tax=Wickerhamomyces pijperi TaxID=599730 RepID=A0A9P8TNB5_WICPI|nr:hypothetical protein WICPIJ_003092 [Wickerhamomyces pijperi]